MSRLPVLAGVVFAAAPLYAQTPPEADPEPEPEAPETDGAADGTDAHEAEDEAPPLEVNARLRLRWTRGLDDPEHPSGDFTLPNARLSVEWHPTERVEGELGADFAPVLSVGGTVPTSGFIPELLDAFVAVETAEWLTLRAGHRKVPFSGGRLISLGNLRPVRRGEYVGFVSADDPANLSTTTVGFSGRKLGVDALFEVRSAARLEIDLGISQGDRGAADPALRATVRPVRGLHVSAAAAALRSPDSEIRAFWAPAYEFDAQFDRWSWRAEVEVGAGENWLDEQHRPFRGGYLLVAYDIDVWDANAMSIEPLVRAERLNQTLGSRCDEVTGWTGGATLHALEVLRLQANVEHLDRADEGECSVVVTEKDETRLFVQVALDT